jgi:hypothetical protein
MAEQNWMTADQSYGSHAALPQLPHRPRGRVDRCLDVRRGFGVGVRDGDAAERLAAQLVGRLAVFPLRVEELQVLVRVTVRPAVDRDGFDVALDMASSCCWISLSKVAKGVV